MLFKKRNQAVPRLWRLFLILCAGIVIALCVFTEYVRLKPAGETTTPAPGEPAPEEALPTRIPTITIDEGLLIIPTAKKTTAPGSDQPECSQPGLGWVSPVDDMMLRCVPAGKFLMGAPPNDPYGRPDEKPQHKINLDTFWIDETEVTNAQFARFVAARNYITEAEVIGGGYAWVGDGVEYTLGAYWKHPKGPESDVEKIDDHPVVQVTWHDALAYCAWAKRRLPTEAEWEKAARDMDGRIFPWGDTPITGDLVNSADKVLAAEWSDFAVNDGYKFTSPVEHYPEGVSPYHAFDMSGNVWEWVQDWYDETYYANSMAENPFGPAMGQDRVLRGGSWYNINLYLRTSMRGKLSPGYRSDSLGFRCAYSP